MREVDRRSKLGRRGFLRTTATAVPAAAVLASAFTADAWADTKALTPDIMATLVRMARDLFPHDRLADIYYVKAVGAWDGKAAADPATRTLIEQGVQRLDAGAQDRFGTSYRLVAWEDDRVGLLRDIEHSPFFSKIRGNLVVALYNQEELWPKFGYEGSSAEHGGYLHRGFDDIDWLPKT